MHWKGITVVSYLPGRVRLHIDALHGDGQLAQRVENEVGDVPGIAKVATNATTGAVLVRYDRRTLAQRGNAERLFDVLRRLFPESDLEELRGRLFKQEQ